MHMADALISPVVGGTMLFLSAGIGIYSVKKVEKDIEDNKIPLMGVMGAFVFAAQMINFSIPGTGSSGHIGGGLLLAILLGPYAGFLTMAAVLLIQAFFFADGGLLAYGANVFNLGFYTCFITYQLIFKKVTLKGFSRKTIYIACILSAAIGLQMGSLSVVLETVLSGKAELPFKSFLILMQPIHLAIGITEGFITAAVVSFVWNTRPELIERTTKGLSLGNISIKKVLVTLSLATLIIIGGLSWFASSNPDGLEWSIEKITGSDELETEGVVYSTMGKIQSFTSIFPDYSFKSEKKETEEELKDMIREEKLESNSETVLVAVIGGGITLFIALMTGFSINIYKRKKNKKQDI
ncbi:energy-coupling factor ABC transporter permease [Clostridium grantii]|uniref:Cobalt/nickel transport system permease protein n=1 Tax=Clostridium grantii DSM 8605 TaxID=1121316 RepID=A0A1M5VYH1_9CLOT|nr:energy-coupling factor ABC transporter permease [Clostridium grantii]SHH80286.1 cobalt/nickel transport system permease protein [Clostridium grantii DSM 8605]